MDKLERVLMVLALGMVLVIPAAGQQGGKERTFIVRTGKPHRETISQTIRKTGGLFAPSTVEVSTKIAGRLEMLSLEDGTRVEEGTRVKKGELIASIETRDYVARKNAAAAALKSAQATLADKERELKRAEMLFKEGTATEQERDLAEADYERAAAAIEQAQAQLDLAQIDLDETAIKSPMDGVVSQKLVEPGTLLTAGARIVTITDTDTLWFQVSVPTTLYSQLALNETGIDIEIDAYPGEQVRAKLSRIYPLAEGETRTIRIEAVLDNAENRYLPGMFAIGALALNERKDVLVVPFEAVIRNVDHYFVYVVDGGKARATRVEVGIRADAVVEIVSGLAEDDQIVVVGQHRLADGVAIRVDNEMATGDAE